MGKIHLENSKITSRHNISRCQYYVYILIANGINVREGIMEYCCKCTVGRRTVALAVFLVDVIVRD